MAAGEIIINNNYVYVSNRDNNLYESNETNKSSIAMFEIMNDNKLLLRQHITSYGNHPRHFIIINNQLLIVNKNSNNLISYLINPINGLIIEESVIINESNELLEPTFILPKL